MISVFVLALAAQFAFAFALALTGPDKIQTLSCQALILIPTFRAVSMLAWDKQTFSLISVAVEGSCSVISPTTSPDDLPHFLRKISLVKASSYQVYKASSLLNVAQ